MNNKKSGNQFETELCEILSKNGFWCHNLAQNSAGQPADVIAVKNGNAYLIDCKVCSNGKFSLNRIEENQSLAMELWRECGNSTGWFALKFGDNIYMVPLATLQAIRNIRTTITEMFAAKGCYKLDDWVAMRR